MKRFAPLILLLLAAPAWGGTYWVSPTGTYGRTPTRDGSDSTDAKALTLAWANDSATAGDVIRLKSSFDVSTDGQGGAGGIPQYDTPIRPKHGGTSNSARIWFIGDVTHPGSRLVTAIQLDTLAGCTGYVSVYGVRAEKTALDNGDLTFNGRHATYDSVAYCKVDGKLDVFGRNYSTITHSRINDGLPWPRSGGGAQTMPDKVNITNGMHTGSLATVQALPDSMNGWLHGFTFTDNLVRTNIGLGVSSNAMTVRLVKSSTFARDTFYVGSVRIPETGSSDAQLNTWYLCQDNDVTDCRFIGSADGTYNEFYLLNVRDYQIANRWYRNTFLEDPNSVKPLKLEFMTAGATDPGDRNNTWIGNFVRVRDIIGYQCNSLGEIHMFNTYLTQATFKWGNTGTARADSLIFKHNTVVRFGANPQIGQDEIDVDTTKASRFNKNIFASLRLPGAPVHGTHTTGHVRIGAFGTADQDSNLYWCASQDSSYAVVAFGYGPATPLAFNALTTSEKGSRHDNPEFADTSWATFDGYPSTSSIAISSNLWGSDGFVGAKGPTADVTAPTVSIVAPEDGLLCPIGESVPITWTASDAVGVTRIDIDRGVVGPSGTTWYTVKHDIAGTETTWFWVPYNTRYTHTQIRVKAYDAAGNSSSDTVEVVQPCAPCSDDDPYREIP